MRAERSELWTSNKYAKLLSNFNVSKIVKSEQIKNYTKLFATAEIIKHQQNQSCALYLLSYRNKSARNNKKTWQMVGAKK